MNLNTYKRVLAKLIVGTIFLGMQNTLIAAETTHLVDITRYQVPHDVPQGASATPEQLAIFAWQEFIALNWPAQTPSETGVRGRPNPKKSFNQAEPGLTVWQTYRHRNELFPGKNTTDPKFDSKAPSYNYRVPTQTANASTSDVLFNNLDESSQINLANLCAHNVPADKCGIAGGMNTYRFLYEAKVNRAIFDYANQAGLTDRSENYKTLNDRRSTTSAKLTEYGAICSSPDEASIVMLPCGDIEVSGDKGEGAIETKAAWRKLTEAEMKSGRFYTAKVQYYSLDAKGGFIVGNDTFGLVGLHIIHKTKSFPAFVFATWEQVDAYDGSNTSGLVFRNTGTKLKNIPVKRDHSIPDHIAKVNQDVHSQVSNVWQYYKLVNVQAQPVDGPPAASASADQRSYYYMANMVIETNQTLQNFYGKAAPTGVVEPSQNVYIGGKSYQMGGCQGCHGTQGQAIGGDMSAIIGLAPVGFVPDTIND